MTVIYALAHIIAILFSVAIGFVDVIIAVVGATMLTGIFFEQIGTCVMKSRSSAYNTWGMHGGGWSGLAFALYGIYAYGVLWTFVGAVLLCVALFIAGFTTWYAFEERYNHGRGCA